jgi:hypothetical protein
MNRARTSIVALGVAGAFAVPTAVLLTPAAVADTESGGTCAGAGYELSVDRERGGFEVDAGIDDANPGSRWKVVLRHEGRVIADVTRRADAEGDLDVDRFRPNTKGKDTFRLRVTHLGSDTTCRTKVVTR